MAEKNTTKPKELAIGSQHQEEMPSDCPSKSTYFPGILLNLYNFTARNNYFTAIQYLTVRRENIMQPEPTQLYRDLPAMFLSAESLFL